MGLEYFLIKLEIGDAWVFSRLKEFENLRNQYDKKSEEKLIYLIRM